VITDAQSARERELQDAHDRGAKLTIAHRSANPGAIHWPTPTSNRLNAPTPGAAAMTPAPYSVESSSARSSIKGMRGGFGGRTPASFGRQVELIRKRIRRWLYGWPRPILINAPRRHMAADHEIADGQCKYVEVLR
jgi:hypothetical protein